MCYWICAELIKLCWEEIISMQVSNQTNPTITTGQQLISPFNNAHRCAFCFASILRGERKAPDKPVWTDIPGVSAGLEAWSKHSQPCKHGNVRPTLGKRCAPRYRLSQQQWKMLTAREEIMQKTPHRHTHMKCSSIHHLVMGSAAVYLQYWDSWCVLMNTGIHPTDVTLSIFPQAVQRHFLYQHLITASRPRNWWHLPRVRYWRPERRKESMHLLQQNMQLPSKHNWPKQTHPWDRVQNS